MIRVLFDACHRHGWLPGLAASATIYVGEFPFHHDEIARFIPEFVMAQLESGQALSKIPHTTTRNLVIVLIETGLRGGDACNLPFSPVLADSSGRPHAGCGADGGIVSGPRRQRADTAPSGPGRPQNAGVAMARARRRLWITRQPVGAGVRRCCVRWQAGKAGSKCIRLGGPRHARRQAHRPGTPAGTGRRGRAPSVAGPSRPGRRCRHCPRPPRTEPVMLLCRNRADRSRSRGTVLCPPTRPSFRC